MASFVRDGARSEWQSGSVSWHCQVFSSSNWMSSGPCFPVLVVYVSLLTVRCFFITLQCSAWIWGSSGGLDTMLILASECGMRQTADAVARSILPAYITWSWSETSKSTAAFCKASNCNSLVFHCSGFFDCMTFWGIKGANRTRLRKRKCPLPYLLLAKRWMSSIIKRFKGDVR